jgi:hypothetical protein
MINYERLLKLADYIEKVPTHTYGEKVTGKQFNFDVVRVQEGCGTMACAMGYTPEVFPEEIGLTMSGGNSRPIFHQTGASSILGIARDFFGIQKTSDIYALFFSDEQWYHPAKLDFLRADATGAQVAQNIRKFVDWSKANE